MSAKYTIRYRGTIMTVCDDKDACLAGIIENIDTRGRMLKHYAVIEQTGTINSTNFREKELDLFKEIKRYKERIANQSNFITCRHCRCYNYATKACDKQHAPTYKYMAHLLCDDFYPYTGDESEYIKLNNGSQIKRPTLQTHSVRGKRSNIVVQQDLYTMFDSIDSSSPTSGGLGHQFENEEPQIAEEAEEPCEIPWGLDDI